MSSVSQIITFRKGRAFTTRKPEPPVVPAPPAAPAVPSAKVTIGGAQAGQSLASVTYAARVQKAPTVQIDTRPPNPRTEPAEEAAAPRPTPAPHPPQAATPAPEPVKDDAAD